jgi:hypothetical protein
MNVKPGVRLVSQVCDTEIVVVKAGDQDVDLRCGGHPMIAAGESPEEAELSSAHAEGTQLGKRYGDDAVGIQVLCTKSGAGSLSIGDAALGRAEAKPLPASD